MKKYDKCRKMNIKGFNILMLAIIIPVLFIIASMNAHALGIAPSTKIIDYDTEEHIVTARIINNENKDMRVLVYVSGELGEYAKIVGENIVKVSSSESEKPFSYSIKLPAGLTPGTKQLQVMALELGDNVDVSQIQSEKTIILSTVMVVHQLKVNVPYPGTYAEGLMYVSEGNVNDTITFTANVINKGSDKISGINGVVVIKGPTNEEITRINSNTLDSIDSKSTDKIVANWKADVNPGVYYAEFVVNYGDKQIVLRKEFMVGSFQIEVKDIKVNNFRLGAIAKFDVNLLSRWNQPIQNVYGDMQIIDPSGNVITSFKTMPADVTPLTTTTITGYWDTKDVQIGNYDVKVVVHYEDKSVERVFKAVVGIDSIQVQDLSSIGNVIATKGSGNQISMLYILVIGSIVFNIGLFIYFKFLRKKNDQ